MANSNLISTSSGEATPANEPLWKRPGLRQFAKFCIVGASSTIISSSLFYLLIKVVGLESRLLDWLAPWPGVWGLVERYDLHIQIAALIGFIFAVTNGFIWNSRWTFGHCGQSNRRRQYIQFVMVNVVGLILNQLILFVVYHALIADKPGEQHDREAFIAFGVAVCIVVFWNFFANKHWTFKNAAPNNPDCEELTF